MAEKAIDKSGMKVFRSGSVEAWLMFEDFTETALDMLDDYGQELNREKENSMAQLPGDHWGLEPLPIEDITRFWLLRGS